MVTLLSSTQKTPAGREQGFTLIELLVVILIIGILAAIAIPMFLNQRKAAADSALKSDVRNLAMEIETWQTKTGKLLNEAPLPDFPTATHERGYVIIVRAGGVAPFAGADNGATAQSVPEGMQMPVVSEGVGMGVMANPSTTQGGYCIMGNNEGGNYYRGLSEGVYNHYKRTVYYDSRAGGLFTAQELPEGGACRAYWNTMDAHGGQEYP